VAHEFIRSELEALPDRESTRGGTFSSAAENTLPQLLASEEFVISNQDTVAHVFTFSPRGATGGTSTFTESIPAGVACKYSGRGIQTVTIDSASAVVYWKAGPRGTVFPLSNPSGAAGGGAAASVQKAIEAASSVSSAHMYGLGTGGSAWTYKPLKSGIVRVTWDAFMLGSGDASATFTMELLPTYGDSGVVAAPAAGAAPPGGSVQPGSGMGLNPTLAAAVINSWNQHDSYTVILFLTAGHTYWFDFEASYNGMTAVALGDAQISFEELPI
jgi:hypothetical protein